MDDIMKFLEIERQQNFSPHDAEKIIEILKEYLICEYKILSNKLIFNFCDKEYIIINEDGNKYRIKMGHKLTLLKSFDELIGSLPDIFDYERLTKKQTGRPETYIYLPYLPSGISGISDEIEIDSAEYYRGISGYSGYK